MRSVSWRRLGLQTLVSRALAGICMVVFASTAGAQAQGDRPIRVVFGFAPGGGGDIIGRVISQKLAERLKTPVPFENRAGANGVIAAGYVARSAPDRALAITSAQRSPVLPSAPTMRELGLDVLLTSFYGFLAPSKTPDDVMKRLNEELVAVIRLPEISARLAHEGAIPIGNSPAEFKGYLGDQIARLSKLLKAARAK